MIWFGNVESHLDCNEDKCKLGGDQGARDQGGEVGWKPFTLWKKVEMILIVGKGGNDLNCGKRWKPFTLWKKVEMI